MKSLLNMFIFSLMIFVLSSCSELREPIEITSVDVTIQLDTMHASTLESGVEVQLNQEGALFELSLTTRTGYIFSDDVTFYINGIHIEQGVVLELRQITYLFDDPTLLNPNAFEHVEVTLDLNGGFFRRSFFEQLEPDQTLSLTTYDDILGRSFTVFDTSYSTLRWFYKLFIAYNHAFDAYEVVYADPATAAISNLDLPLYDYILAVHDQTTDIQTKEQIISYTQTFKPRMFVLFDQDIQSYVSGEMVVSFYTNEQISGIYETTLIDPTPLPIPIRETFTFLGWETQTSIETQFLGFRRNENVKSITYKALWEGATLQELHQYLDSLIPSKATQNLTLPTAYSGYQIDWSSTDIHVISTTGAYQRPYLETTVVLTANITLGEETFTRVYDVQADGYKSLAAPIASSYIYRNYSAVDDNFFEILDIINTAFITAQPDGSLIGTNYLYNVATHIMPRAKAHGNWVIMSVAPESAWSTIAASTALLNTFADNIVEMINTHGFDGVDIDWETPTNAERTRYTQLMRVVYEKVKANNPNHLVTTAITGGMWQPPQYDLLNSAPYIDYINMMTYSMTSNGGQYQNALFPRSSFHHAGFRAGRTLISCSIEESVAIFNNQFHIPNGKIIVGVAFYGIRQTRSFNTSTQTWTAWSAAGSVFYNEIINQYLSNADFIKAYDTTAGVPYMLKTDGTVFISYDNPRSIADKSAYIIDEGLGGMMFWEYGADTTGTLLNAMGSGLNK